MTASAEQTAPDRTALVTGGTRGIGRAIAAALQDTGVTVFAGYLSDDATAKRFTDETGIPALKFDVGDFEACQDAVAQITAAAGPVDILVNNAGITRDATIGRMTAEDWNAVIRTNLTGCFNTAHAVFDSMCARGFGRIVNIGSINGQAGQYGQVNYAAAKSGIHGFTKALAQEGARAGVTVNAVAPGYVKTDIVSAVPEPVLKKITAKIPVGRMGTAEDIARAVLFLCDENAEFITGATLSVNGGHHMY